MGGVRSVAGTVTGPSVSDGASQAAVPRRDRTFLLVFVGVFAGLIAFVFVPIVAVTSSGLLFGGDWAQYLLTSQVYLDHQSNLLTYPFPALPIAYLPVTVLFSNSIAAAYAAEVVSGVLLLAIYLAAYRFFASLTGSPWAGIAGALFLASSPLLLDELGWGGQAQYLAIVLGLLAAHVMLTQVEGRERWEGAIGAGLLLAAAALSEGYAAAYFVLGIGVWLVLEHRWDVFRRPWLLRAAAILLPALAVLGILAALNRSIADNTVGRPLLDAAGSLPLYEALYLRLTFHSGFLIVLYPLLAVAYVLIWKNLNRDRPGTRTFLPAFVIAWVPVFLFLTPAVDTDRALYFALLPLATMVTGSAEALPQLWARDRETVPSSGPEPLRRWGRIPRGPAAVVPVLAVVALLTVGVQVGVASHTYYGSLTYYAYNADVLKELAQLNDKNGSLLLVSPNLGVFPAAWASGRNAYFGPPSQPATFTRSSQQASVVAANVLAGGPSWINAGSTWVIDGEPGWATPAPGLLEESGLFLVETLALNDSRAWITYSPTAFPNETEGLSLFSAPSIVHVVNPTNLTTTYTWTDVTVTKVVSVDAVGDVRIALRFAFQAAIPRAIGVSLTTPAGLPTTTTVLSAALPSQLELQQTYDAGFLPTLFTDSVGVSATGLTGTTAYTDANSTGPGYVTVALTPTSANATTLDATISIRPNGIAPGPVVVETEASVLAADDIAWVAVERSSGNAYLERFLNDPTFSLVSSGTYYLIFETKWA